MQQFSQVDPIFQFALILFEVSVHENLEEVEREVGSLRGLAKIDFPDANGATNSG